MSTTILAILCFALGSAITAAFFCWRTKFLLSRGFTHEQIHNSICGDA